MNIANILNRKLGLVTVQNLQRVFNFFSTSLGLVDGAIPDSRPYKVYTARVEQSGTDAPVSDVVYENTLGGTPVWSRTSTGSYSLTLAGAFPEQSIFIVTPQISWYYEPEDKHLQAVLGWETDNNLTFDTRDLTAGLIDNILNFSPTGYFNFEIRVYN